MIAKDMFALWTFMTSSRVTATQQLAAELLWALLLFPSNMKSRTKQIVVGPGQEFHLGDQLWLSGSSRAVLSLEKREVVDRNYVLFMMRPTIPSRKLTR